MAAVTAKLPVYFSDWTRAIKHCNLEGESIHSAGLSSSASKTTFEQYLLLRVLRRGSQGPNQLEKVATARRWIDDKDISEAEKLLGELTGWPGYLESLTQAIDELHRKRWPGLYASVIARVWQSRTGGLRNPWKQQDYVPKLDFTPVAARTRFRRRQIDFATPSRSTGLANLGLSTLPGGCSESPTGNGENEEGDGKTEEEDERVSDNLKAERHNKEDELYEDELELLKFGSESTAARTTHENEKGAEGGQFTFGITERFGRLSISETPGALATPLTSSTLEMSSLLRSPLSPFTGDTYRDSKTLTDEQVINSAIIALLESLTIYFACLRLFGLLSAVPLLSGMA
jgi:hypothetical protein